MVKPRHWIVVVFLFCSSVLISQPKIFLNKTTVDLGTIYQGEIKIIHLLISNTGTSPLTIKGVETSCGCTSARKPKSLLAPGESDTVLVTFNSAGFDGSIKKHVTIQSDDISSPFIESVFTGTVTTELVTIPKTPVILIGIQPLHQAAGKTIQIKNTSDHLLTIRNFSSSDTNVSVSFEKKKIPAGDTTSVTFTVTPTSTLFVDTIVYIETDSKHQSKVPFRVTYAGKK